MPDLQDMGGVSPELSRIIRDHWQPRPSSHSLKFAGEVVRLLLPDAHVDLRNALFLLITTDPTQHVVREAALTLIRRHTKDVDPQPEDSRPTIWERLYESD